MRVQKQNVRIVCGQAWRNIRDPTLSPPAPLYTYGDHSKIFRQKTLGGNDVGKQGNFGRQSRQGR